MSQDYNQGRNGVFTGSEANKAGYYQYQAEQAAKKKREAEERARRERESRQKFWDQQQSLQRKNADTNQKKLASARPSPIAQWKSNPPYNSSPPMHPSSNFSTTTTLPLISPSLSDEILLNNPPEGISVKEWRRICKPTLWDKVVVYSQLILFSLIALSALLGLAYLAYGLLIGDWLLDKFSAIT